MQRHVPSAVRLRGIFILAALLCSAPAFADTFYVRKSGDDMNSGRTPGRAFLTIGKAASQLGSSHIIVVGPGRYGEEISEFGGSGRPNKPLILFGDRAGDFTGDPPGDVIIDASDFDNGFRVASRMWVFINGFTVVNARGHAIVLKSGCDNCVVANNTVVASGGRGILVQDSASVIVFNNLVYDNQRTGVDVDQSSPESIVINNTIYRNGINGVRLEGGLRPSLNATVLNNIIAENGSEGINVQDASSEGFLGQWNLNTDGYSNASVSRPSLDLDHSPSFVAPENADFALSQMAAGQGTDSVAVDASGIRAKKIDFGGAWTRSDEKRDKGRVDLGFHRGSTTDLVTTLRGNKKRGPRFKINKKYAKRLRKLRDLAERCESKAEKARELRNSGRGACASNRGRKKFARQCGTATATVCGEGSPSAAFLDVTSGLLQW
jgi:parallel beta-helix repeat protein